MSGKECKDEKCEEAPRSCDRLDILRDLTKALNEVFTKKLSLLDETLENLLGDKVENLSTTTFSVPLYQKWQACFAVQEYLAANSKDLKVTRYVSSGEKLVPPSYMEIEIKRNTFKSLLLMGWRFFEWRGIKISAMSDFLGKSAETTFWSNKKDYPKVLELIQEIRAFMKEHNYFKGEKLKVVEGCFFEFLEYPTHSFDEIILDPKFKEELVLNLLFPMENEDLCKEYSIPWRRGILIGGEPGTGKTKLAKVLCNLLKCTVLWVSTESITQAWEMKQLFEGARLLSPTLIIFEDVDFLGTDREIDRNPILGEMLNQLDGNSPNYGIFVLASTNRPNLLDRALANRPGRFDLKLELTKPDLEARKQLITLFMKGKKFDVSIDLNRFAADTEGLTGSHIQEVITYGMLDALKSNFRILRTENIMKGLRSVKGKDQKNDMSR